MNQERAQQYISQMRPMFNKHALYSDASPQYQSPFDPFPDASEQRGRGVFHQWEIQEADADRLCPQRLRLL